MLILASKYGRLCNRLFHYAKFVTLAAEYQLSTANIAFDEYVEYFQKTSQDLFFRFPPNESIFPTNRTFRNLIYRFIARVVLAVEKYIDANNITFIRTEFNNTYELSNKDLIDRSRKGLVFFYGWPKLDKKLYIKHYDVLRSFFEPLDQYVQNVKVIIERARDRADVLIGVHIRRSDYKYWKNGEYYFEIDVYKKCMRRAEELFPSKRVAFLVCSDEYLDSGKFSMFQSYMGSGHLIEDLYALAACDYLVGTLSTYSSWASFYGNIPLYVINDAECPKSLSDFRYWIDS